MKNPLFLNKLPRHALRGGCWNYGTRNSRVSYRLNYRVSYRYHFQGFRLFRTEEKA